MTHFPSAWLRVSWIILLSAALFACDDDPEPSPETNATSSTTSATSTSATTPTGSTTETGSSTSSTTSTSATECTPEERECVDETTTRRCLPTGTWGNDNPCSDEEVCEAGECVFNPANCVQGQTICLDAQTPAECNPGVGWRPFPACPEEQGCLDGVCRSRACTDAADAASYIGCDYLTVDLPNLAFGPATTPEAPLGVVLANPDPFNSATFSVYAPSGALATLLPEVTVEPPEIAADQGQATTVQSEIRDANGLPVSNNMSQASALEIPPGGLAILLLPHEPYFENTGIRAHARRIQTTRPVVAYQFSPYCCNFSYSNDASLLLPVATFGKDYRYLGIPTWVEPSGDPNNFSAGPATLTVAAAYDRTQVDITVPQGVALRTDTTGRVSVQGRQVNATLQSGEVLHLFTEPPATSSFNAIGDDLTGSIIASSQPVAVFSGHLCSFYPQDQGACDHTEEQLFPTETWGKNFTLTPTALRTTSDFATEATFWKILARDDDTTLVFSAPYNELGASPPGFNGVPNCAALLEADNVTLRLNANQTCEFGSRRAVELNADKPLMIMGIISGQDSTGAAFFGEHAGDPAVFLMPPRDQFRRDYVFLTPTTYFSDFVTITTGSNASVTLDGETISLAEATPVLGSSQVFLHIPLEDGPHTITSSQPAGIIVYAYDDYVSYAFTGGLNLTKSR